MSPCTLCAILFAFFFTLNHVVALCRHHFESVINSFGLSKKRGLPLLSPLATIKCNFLIYLCVYVRIYLFFKHSSNYFSTMVLLSIEAWNTRCCLPSSIFVSPANQNAALCDDAGSLAWSLGTNWSMCPAWMTSYWSGDNVHFFMRSSGSVTCCRTRGRKENSLLKCIVIYCGVWWRDCKAAL